MFRVTLLFYIVLLITTVICKSVQKPTLDGFIVGGEIVSIEDYPHQVTLLWTGIFFCGGFIVSPRWVVTAAHCVAGVPINGTTIRAGSSFRDRGGIVFNVVSNVNHPKYDWQTLDYDVAMLKVDREFDFLGPFPMKQIPYECASSNDIQDGTPLRVSGFGETLVPGEDHTYLRAVTVMKISLKSCQEKHEAYQFPVNENMLCAGKSGGGQDACSGDSGSALVDPADGCVVGVVSWGIGCARPGYPGVYARIASVAAFIRELVDNL